MVKIYWSFRHLGIVVYDHFRKPDPVKHCGTCSELMTRRRFQPSGYLESMSAFIKRRFCSRACRDVSLEGPRGVVTDPSGSRAYARDKVPPGPCSRCNKPNGIDVHHKDRDCFNNAIENLERLCRGCHLREHRSAA